MSGSGPTTAFLARDAESAAEVAQTLCASGSCAGRCARRWAAERLLTPDRRGIWPPDAGPHARWANARAGHRWARPDATPWRRTRSSPDLHTNVTDFHADVRQSQY
ncbi:hypothetical protein AB0N07_39945 [Streptomyces sp. NPDC051172]|uniref:hypothetical protein n=1 Tax=Streptomyces sp. NPDC051172 TaxID=3155796 RepID=UPI00343F5AAB